MSAWIESAQSVNSFFAILKTTRALPRLALPCRALPRLAKPSRAEPCPESFNRRLHPQPRPTLPSSDAECSITCAECKHPRPRNESATHQSVAASDARPQS